MLYADLAIGESAPKLGGKVVAVVVSRDRPAELRKTLQILLQQRLSAGSLEILIIDSSADAHAVGAAAAAPGVRLIRSSVNLGGAGGYALGMLEALAAGAHWIWLMDDDGRPQHDGALECLLETAAERRLDAVAPAVLDPDDPSRFAFPYQMRQRYVFERGELPDGAFLPGAAHLFNGLLMRASAIFKTGLPDMRMFIRGDEIDFLHRMRQAGLAFGTTVNARFEHPSSNTELFPVFGGRLRVVYPQPGWKRRSQYRNRAYNYIKHRVLLMLMVDCVRYPYFFLICRRFDIAGLKEWLTCTWEGVCGNVYVDPSIDLEPHPLDLPLAPRN